MFKNTLKTIIPYLPDSLRKKLGLYITKKKIAQHKQRKQRVHVTLLQIEEILDQFDFSCDVMIHSSTSNIGKIEGGAVNLTKLIVSKIDLTKHSLLAPALPYLGATKDYLAKLDCFDLKSAKNAMGNISNQIMKMDECNRSFHPTHSVVSIGKKSKYYSENHEKTITPFAEDSPYYKLTANNGKILMFGVGLNSVTNFHVYEDILAEHLPFNVYSKKVFNIESINEGNKATITTPMHSLQQSSKRDCERARKTLLKKNYIKSFPLGDSEVSVLDAKGLTIILLEMLLKGTSIYGNVKLQKQHKEVIKNKLAELTKQGDEHKI
jgi:aminoglycoside 3-N-acetyltransferase